VKIISASAVFKKIKDDKKTASVMVYISLESKHVATKVESSKSRDVQNVNCIVFGRKLIIF
jgi:hypothetical protein